MAGMDVTDLTPLFSSSSSTSGSSDDGVIQHPSPKVSKYTWTMWVMAYSAYIVCTCNYMYYTWYHMAGNFHGVLSFIYLVDNGFLI